MTDRSAKAIAAEGKFHANVVAIAEGMIPARHLDIWAACRKKYDDIGPSEVWRILMDSGRMQYDFNTTMFN